METKTMRRVDPESFLYGGNSGFIFDIYQKFRVDPESVDNDWRQFFSELGAEAHQLFGVDDRAPKWSGKKPQANANNQPESALSSSQLRDSIRALMMVRAHRVRGHLNANLDPLGIDKRGDHAELDLKTYGFSANDLPKRIFVDNLLGLEMPTLGKLVTRLRQIYCGSVGIEFMHIQEPDQKNWIQERVENTPPKGRVDDNDRVEILKYLAAAELFERFLHVKYPGAKRFGLEGGESLIPALDSLTKRCSELGVEKIVFGMAHRGRLSVLTNILEKPCHKIFAHFQGGDIDPESFQGSGDVKYHLGYSGQRNINGRPLKLTLMPNPSHLEAVNPVVLGKVRAEQLMHNDETRRRILSVLIHGDAAFAGQGLVAETLELSGLRGYKTGGTIHIITNNQIGFTTSPPHSRSSPYSSDVAKVIQAPVFHVNADDPEAVVWATRLAVDFQRQFSQDVVIDIICYRRNGHNEIDEPSFTQPLMYKKIAQHASTFKQYSEKLIADAVVTEAEVKNIVEGYEAKLRQELGNLTPEKSSAIISKNEWLEGSWAKILMPRNQEPEWDMCPKTGVPLQTLEQISQSLAKVPAAFKINTRLERILKAKQQTLENREDIDWATGEALAFGSLLLEGRNVRLSGQDVGRGTFSHRHAVWIDQENEERHIPLNNITATQATFEVVDSPLAEASVLGFEYGYSFTNPYSLVIWEAQFGDFANGAQVIIDQFISSGEHKWNRLCGLVMLLPHGFEGQGPEHSSARLERFLQLCAEGNMRVVNCSTPANYFHVLRRQLHSKTRKPLIVMSPKTLLRHKLAVSKFTDMAEGTHFAPVLPDREVKPSAVKRVVLCSGKVYYELYQKRQELGVNDVALVRLEQYYPLPHSHLVEHLKPYARAEFVWCQEEPANMGAWTYLDRRLEAVLGAINAKHQRFNYVGRPEAASPATGNASRHEAEQNALINQALNHSNKKTSVVF